MHPLADMGLLDVLYMYSVETLFILKLCSANSGPACVTMYSNSWSVVGAEFMVLAHLAVDADDLLDSTLTTN